MEGHHHHQFSVNIEAGGDRVPQWSIQETKEFLAIRAELDQAFMETKRNKLLWEVISNKMKERGFHRSAEQCKCKWKNLVTRYKGSETMEMESMRQQFPFYNELQAIFTNRMQRMLWLESEGGGSSTTSSLKKKGVRLMSSDDEDDNEEINSDDEKGGHISKKKKMKSIKNTTSTSNNNNSNLQEILEEFMRQQMQMEMQWRESYEAREEERRIKEVEWRHRMEAIEKERFLLERSWREREEQRRMREEARAEKRDALITALLNKLGREDSI